MRYNFSGVSFINSLPFFCAEPPSDFDLFLSYPSDLNERVKNKISDVSMISRWVYPSCEDDYEVLPNYCIGGDGEIISIKLFSNFEISRLWEGSIYITEQTGTSSRAFRKICQQRYGFDIFELPRAPLETADSAILIGDNAMLFDSSRFKYAYDLGELWKDFANCKMLYAVFVIRKNLFKELAGRVAEYLNESLACFERDPEKIYAKAVEISGGRLSVADVKRYYSRLIFKMDSRDFEKSFNFVKNYGAI